MKNTITALIVVSVLSGCQIVGQTPATSSAQMAMTGAAASAIAADMADQLAEQVGEAGTTILKIDKDASEYAAALEAALMGQGYTVMNHEKVGKAQRAVMIAWSIDSLDGQVLARVSTPAIALARAYTVTSTGATPASPISIMQRN